MIRDFISHQTNKNNISTGLRYVLPFWANYNNRPRLRKSKHKSREKSRTGKTKDITRRRRRRRIQSKQKPPPKKIGRHRQRLTVLRSSYFFVFFRASSVAPHISWLTSSNVRKVPKMATFFFFFYDYRKDRKESADAADTVLPITRPFCVSVCVPLVFFFSSFPFWGVQKNRQVDHWGGNVVKDFYYFFFLFRLFRTRGISLSWPSSVVCRVTSLFSIRESR